MPIKIVMNTLVRIVLTIVAFLGTQFFAFWISAAFMPRNAAMLVLPSLIALGLAFAAARFVWIRTATPSTTQHGAPRPGGLLSSVATGAIVLGTIAFCAGFFGPMVFAPGANQGPLLGLFITGPLGFLAGGIGGGIYWAVKRG
jgi:hypothetical protein